MNIAAQLFLGFIISNTSYSSDLVRWTSPSGAEFVRGFSENLSTWQDPHRVRWHELALTDQNGRVANLSQDAAQARCESVGAKLPSLEQIRNLAIFLGDTTQLEAIDGTPAALLTPVFYTSGSAAVLLWTREQEETEGGPFGFAYQLTTRRSVRLTKDRIRAGLAHTANPRRSFVMTRCIEGTN